MSAALIEGIPIVLFFLLLVGSIIGEVLWLVRKEWTTSGRAIAYVMLTDLISLFLGGFVVMVVFMILLMMTLGPAGRGSDAPEIAYIATMVAAVVLPPAILFLLKRILLALFKIRSGRAAWIYSLVVSLLVTVVVVVPPPVVFWVIGTLLAWK
jgi:hypothetical protein